MQRVVDERQVGEEVVGRMVDRVVSASQQARGRPLEEVINETLYHERLRLKRSNGSARAKADRQFYARVGRELPHVGEARQRLLLQEIVEHYVQEIGGHFDERVYQLATTALPFGLIALLNGLSPKSLVSSLPRLPTIDDRIVIEGEVDALRSLAGRGTVILAPTHTSNLDSPLMGWAIFRMGLPPFAYGAGLNLFSNPLLGFFMNHLGAYTVDRLKTDPLYRDTLKDYCTISLELGQHNLFFPGGTRSRSGAVETHLKKGLLGCGIAAFRHNLEQNPDAGRIFVVPCTATYPLVLEAQTLIDDFLSESGKSRYIIVDDEFSRPRRWFDFLRGLMQLDQRVRVRIGKPLDPFGNDVDPDGTSRDPRGRAIDVRRYLMDAGKLVDDPARDAEYTRLLSARLVEAYHRDTVALPSSVVAFAFFELLRRQQPRQTDLYRLLRTMGPETSVPLAEVEEAVARVLGELRELDSHGRIQMSEELEGDDVRGILRQALRTLGTYHNVPVVERRGRRLHVGNANLLFYYRNRLEGFGLMGAPDLVPHRRDP